MQQKTLTAAGQTKTQPRPGFMRDNYVALNPCTGSAGVSPASVGVSPTKLPNAVVSRHACIHRSLALPALCGRTRFAKLPREQYLRSIYDRPACSLSPPQSSEALAKEDAGRELEREPNQQQGWLIVPMTTMRLASLFPSPRPAGRGTGRGVRLFGVHGQPRPPRIGRALGP